MKEPDAGGGRSHDANARPNCIASAERHGPNSHSKTGHAGDADDDCDSAPRRLSKALAVLQAQGPQNLQYARDRQKNPSPELLTHWTSGNRAGPHRSGRRQAELLLEVGNRLEQTINLPWRVIGVDLDAQQAFREADSRTSRRLHVVTPSKQPFARGKW